MTLLPMRGGDSELFKDKVEVSLDGRQIFYLFFGGAVIACLVFVLGVMVGKRVEARTHAHADTPASVADDPLAALDKLSAEQGHLAFPEALRGESDKPLGLVDRVLAEPAAVAPDLSQKASQSDKASKSQKPAVVEAAPKAVASAVHEAPTQAAKVKPAPEKKTTGKTESPAARKRHWTLQLSSFQDRAEADSFHAKLVGQGYEPYIVEAEVPGKGTWYRVRLGSYPGYDAAIRAKKRFEGKQKIIAYVTRVKGR